MSIAIKTYIDSKLCSTCGGKCCKGHAGIVFPQELGTNIEQELRCRLVTHNWVIDWWEGDPREDKEELDLVYYFRPAHIHGEWPKDPSWGGRCVFLESDGCSLSSEKRPLQCKTLEPIRGNRELECKSHGYTKKDAAIAWIPHQEIVLRILNKIEENNGSLV